MKKLFTLSLIAALLSSYMLEAQNKHLTYQNIVILSDMSSRIRNLRFPPKDIEEIHKIVEYFKNECVMPGKKIGDKSSIAFSAFSQQDIISIDIGEMKNLTEKQSFINSTGKYQYCGLKEELVKFEDSIKRLYTEINNPGLDLISILIEKIENEPIVKRDVPLIDGIDTIFIHYENHIYVFTDGYLEYALSQKQQNSQYYFGAPEIERIRQDCKNNNVAVDEALNKNISLRLPSCKTNKNKFINLHILETHERDKDTQYQTYVHPKGLRDNEILKAVWQKWANESGFKSFEWKKY
jgi:hypothetical protein